MTNRTTIGRGNGKEGVGYFRMSIILVMLMLSVQVAHAASKRVALVIGNADYTEESRLRNPANDARDMAKVLRGLGFEVFEHRNTDWNVFDDSLNGFYDRLASAEVGLFYYSGHGMRDERTSSNYLLPVDAKIARTSHIRRNGFDARGILDEMKQSGVGVSLMFLDACRNNPFATGVKGVPKGLARIAAPTGSLVGFAADYGQTADDGNRENGAYTEYLIEHLATPGVSLGDLLTRVRSAVLEETGGRQRPVEENRLTQPLYLAGEVVRTEGLQPAVPGLALMESEIVFWQSVSGSTDCEAYGAYLTNYPSGRFRMLAELGQRRYCVEATASTSSEVELAGGMEIRDVLEECVEHLEANRLTTGKGGNALDCYTEALQMDPGNAKALDGITAIEDKYINWVKREIKRRNVMRAERFLESLKRVNADLTAVKELQTQIESLGSTPPRPFPEFGEYSKEVLAKIRSHPALRGAPPLKFDSVTVVTKPPLIKPIPYKTLSGKEITCPEGDNRNRLEASQVENGIILSSFQHESTWYFYSIDFDNREKSRCDLNGSKGTGKYVAALNGLLPIYSVSRSESTAGSDRGEITDSFSYTTRISNIDGSLFPMRVGNRLSLTYVQKSNMMVEFDDNNNSYHPVKEQAYDTIYVVKRKLKGLVVDSRIPGDVYEIETTGKYDMKNIDGKYEKQTFVSTTFYSEKLGIMIGGDWGSGQKVELLDITYR